MATESQIVLAQWNEIGRKLIAIAEDLPENKYDYKPNPDSRTFVGQLLHASASMYYFTDAAQGQKVRYPDDPSRENLKTRADIVAFVKKSVEDGAALIKSKGDKGMSEIFTDTDSKQQMHISDPVSYTHLDVYKRQGFNNRFAYRGNIAARGKIHHRIRAVMHGVVQFLQLLIDIRVGRGISNVRVDLAFAGDADGHGLQIAVMDIGRHNGPPARDLGAQHFGIELLALPGELHLFG